MKNVLLILCVGLFVCLTIDLTAAPIPAKWMAWDHLGSKKVNFGLEADVIKVGAQEGVFTKLKVQVTGGAVNMRKMIVQYKNGQREEIELKERFKPGSGSRIIDLKGNKRIIKGIAFLYDSVNKPTGKATVHVFGKH